MILDQFSVKQISRARKFLDHQMTLEPDCLLIFGPQEALRKPQFQELFTGEQLRVPVVGASSNHVIAGSKVAKDETVVTALKFDGPWAMQKWSLDASLENLHREISDWMVGNQFLHGIMFVHTQHPSAHELFNQISKRFADLKIQVAGLYQRETSNPESLLMDGQLFREHVILVGWRAKSVIHTASGWQPFGPVRTVTKVVDQGLLKIDAEEAYEIYKKYMGFAAEDFIRAAKNFPLLLIDPSGAIRGVRTFVRYRESDHALIFSGPVQEGQLCRFAHTTNKRMLLAASEILGGTGFREGTFRFIFGTLDRLETMVDDVLDEVQHGADPNLKHCGAYSDSVILLGDQSKEVLQNQILVGMYGEKT